MTGGEGAATTLLNRMTWLSWGLAPISLMDTTGRLTMVGALEASYARGDDPGSPPLGPALDSPFGEVEGRTRAI